MNSRNGGRRVVITGVGVVTNLGHDARSVWEGMREGRSGVSRIDDPAFDQYEGWTVRIGGQVRDWNPLDRMEKPLLRKMDRCSHLGMWAADEAMADSGLDLSKEDVSRCGVVTGSGIGGIWTIEEGLNILHDRGPKRIGPFTVPRLMVNATTGNISIRFGLEGPASSHATACASSGHAIGDAVNYIRRGRADVMLSGGTEAAITPLCIGAFMAMKALSTRNDDPARASRPFDVNRDGFVLSEGAGIYVLESEQHAKARGAKIYAELSGWANSSDASHIAAPEPEGRGAARSMRWALEDAGLEPGDIGYINAHGTSTPLGDEAEVRAVLSVFGDHARASAGGRLLMSSTKSMHGHSLGASGALELLACIHAVSEGVAPPTINLDEPDKEFDIDLVPHESKERPMRYAMNNTFGFGGHNVTLIAGRYEG